MEIERKFLIDKFPDLPMLYEAVQYQGYLSTDPVVRIRCEESANYKEYKLCFKGKGTLQREEIELDIDEDTFRKLNNLITKPLIKKDYKVFSLGKYYLECSSVDEGSPTGFMYAEIEFDDIDEAKNYKPPVFLHNEVTEKTGYTMAEYWIKK